MKFAESENSVSCMRGPGVKPIYHGSRISILLCYAL